MAGGTVNRSVLTSFYQSPGDLYDDTKTEGALETIAGQVDANWIDYAAHNHDTRYYTEAEIDTKLQQVQAGVLVDQSVVNTKLANDIKVGSLATLRTVDISSITAAMNEIQTKRMYKVVW